MKMGRAGMFTLAVMAFAALGSSLRIFGRMMHRGAGSSHNGRQAFSGNMRKAHLQRVKYARGWV
jgi:hypothetical protein